MAYKPLTVKVTFENGGQMLFGNSYRQWHDQLAEYCRMFDRMPVAVCASCWPWVSFGGLKWCSPEAFQAQLDEEGKGRKAADWLWGPLPKSFQKAWSETIEELANRRQRKMTNIG
jgi:hypothetical protein